MGNTLVEIKVSRDEDELIYSVDCSSELTSEELEYYLEELFKGICKWKPNMRGACKKICANH